MAQQPSSVGIDNPWYPEVRGPIQDVLELCKKYGIAFGTTPSDGEAAGEWARKGACFFETESEIGLIRAGATALLADYRRQIS